MTVRLLTGDCRDRMAELPECSVDAIVCDPPYGLTAARPTGRSAATEGAVMKGFMGLAWDGRVPGVEFWTAALRVAKPGAYLIAFGGTRTSHRLACAIEDAGWEIRDTLGWLYGSGFPKSLDVAKAIDKAAGAVGETIPVGDPVKRMIPGADKDRTGSWIKDNGREYQPGEYRPAHPDAARWQGWGTALKPAWEPILLARKPLAGTVAANVQAHGTGALNIDGCRVEATDNVRFERAAGNVSRENWRKGTCVGGAIPTNQGRWPANILHDGSDEVLAVFPAEAGAAHPVHRRNGDKFCQAYGAFAGNIDEAGSTFHGDRGSAARFFWSPKASTAERNLGLGPSDQNRHPTVKPVDLMAYLCRLVCPPGGVILDPFMGSGSTGIAASREGFGFIGIDLDPEHCRIARLRITGDAPLLARVSP